MVAHGQVFDRKPGYAHCEDPKPLPWTYDGQAGSNPKVRVADHPSRIVDPRADERRNPGCRKYERSPNEVARYAGSGSCLLTRLALGGGHRARLDRRVDLHPRPA